MRLVRARHRFWERTYLGFWEGKLKLLRKPGYQEKIAEHYNMYAGKRCFILCNGPSLKAQDLSPLKGEITIGSNGIYKGFQDFGFHTNFLFFEDIEQLELRRNDFPKIKGPKKLAALYNAYAVKADSDTLFFNAPRMRKNLYYWNELYPQFSKDFAAIVHLGSTITYVMLQWAYYLGCEKVYLLGLDHNYGKLPKLFQPGKIDVTAENIEKIRGLHYTDSYYKIGDQIGVPDVDRQEQAFELAQKQFQAAGRTLVNLTPDTKLEAIPKDAYASVINQ
ncbi:DUF115 domain-containing protein [Puniceicoccaceae bacterium K14]|nr:DUF115 domain-containing protein [Puniceicoccaceae bacterium K14]